jgi:tetratricopeptide (TPR) repeat protein
MTYLVITHHCRAYLDAVQSYATAIVLTEDGHKEDAIIVSSEYHGSDGSMVAEYDKLLFIAIANAGLGLCYLKIKEHSRAVEHLKAAIGHMTDDMFSRRVVSPPRKVPFMQSPEVANRETDSSTCEHRILTLATATTEAYHLLNALESLSDAYVAMREWEKAMYTANFSSEVCQCFLDIIRPESTPSTIGLNEEGTPIGAVEQAIKVNSLSIEIKEHVAMALRVRCTVSLLESAADDLQSERESHIKAICKKRAYSLLARGHMMKKILYHDINRMDGSGEATEGYSFGGLDKALSNEPLHRPSYSSTTPDAGVSAVEAIAALWNDSAAEFDRLGDLKEAFRVYKDVAALWGSLAAFEPYSDSLYLVETCSPRNELITADAPPTADPSTLSNTECRDFDARVQNALPIQPTSTENVRRIEAAIKAKDAWVVAADVARKLCKKAPDGELHADEEEAESQRNGLNITEVQRLDLEMSSWREVIQCQYYAGLCAILHGMAAAEELFEKAQDTKGIYQDVACALSEAEKKEEIKDTLVIGGADASPEGDGAQQQSSSGSAVVMIDQIPNRRELSKQSWLSYNTLCCDISYHLAYTYLRGERFAYAIAEAEMALGLATRSSESKVRRRKCWGLLALGFHASGQAPETAKALKEVEQLLPGNRTEGAESLDDEYVKLLHLFMGHNVSRKSKKFVTGVVQLVESGDEKSKEYDLDSPKSSSLYSSLLDMKQFDRKVLFFLYLGATSFLVLILSIFIAFLV